MEPASSSASTKPKPAPSMRGKADAPQPYLRNDMSLNRLRSARHRDRSRCGSTYQPRNLFSVLERTPSLHSKGAKTSVAAWFTGGENLQQAIDIFKKLSRHQASCQNTNCSWVFRENAVGPLAKQCVLISFLMIALRR